MNATTRLCALAICLWLSALTAQARAETVYVVDRIEIGVHEDTNFDSVIVALIPSGTPLAVIARTGEFVEVETPDGTRGWVDARYVVSEKPGVALPAENDAKLEEAVRSLGAARAEVEVLRQRVTELQRDAATAMSNAPDVANPAPSASSAVAAELKDAKRKLGNLAAENLQLKAHISELQAIQIASEKSAAETRAEDNDASTSSVWVEPVSDQSRTWAPWQWLLYGSILLLAFSAGGYVVDWQSRRRHGGFRV